MSSVYIYDPYIHTQSTPADTWTLAHNFGRTVNVEFYNESGDRIYPSEKEVDLNTYQAKFYVGGVLAPVAGKAIVS